MIPLCQSEPRGAIQRLSVQLLATYDGATGIYPHHASTRAAVTFG